MSYWFHASQAHDKNKTTLRAMVPGQWIKIFVVRLGFGGDGFQLKIPARELIAENEQ